MHVYIPIIYVILYMKCCQTCSLVLSVNLRNFLLKLCWQVQLLYDKVHSLIIDSWQQENFIFTS